MILSLVDYVIDIGLSIMNSERFVYSPSTLYRVRWAIFDIVGGEGGSKQSIAKSKVWLSMKPNRVHIKYKIWPNVDLKLARITKFKISIYQINFTQTSMDTPTKKNYEKKFIGIWDVRWVVGRVYS